MKVYSLTILLVFTLLLSCSYINKDSAIQEVEVALDSVSTQENSEVDSSINSIHQRFSPPPGYNRIQTFDSFALYLRNLPLKEAGANVSYFNGDIKPNHQVYAAVIDLPIGKKNLHQCADAVMRLKAEYHWRKKEYEKIHFNYTNGFRVDYSKWRQGYRVKVKGNQCSWVKSAEPSDSYGTFWKYMEAIFNYAGTMSLSKELISTPRDSMKMGDVFIQGGFPGHAVIVVDMAINAQGEKVFMLAQSYMPAQDAQVLYNPKKDQNTWYPLNFGEVLETPEWTFKSSDLKRFHE